MKRSELEAMELIASGTREVAEYEHSDDPVEETRRFNEAYNKANKHIKDLEKRAVDAGLCMSYAEGKGLGLKMLQEYAGFWKPGVTPDYDNGVWKIEEN